MAHRGAKWKFFESYLRATQRDRNAAPNDNKAQLIKVRISIYYGAVHRRAVALRFIPLLVLTTSIFVSLTFQSQEVPRRFFGVTVTWPHSPPPPLQIGTTAFGYSITTGLGKDLTAQLKQAISTGNYSEQTAGVPHPSFVQIKKVRFRRFYFYVKLQIAA